MYEELKQLKKKKKPWRVNINTYGDCKVFCMNKNTEKNKTLVNLYDLFYYMKLYSFNLQKFWTTPHFFTFSEKNWKYEQQFIKTSADTHGNTVHKTKIEIVQV